MQTIIWDIDDVLNDLTGSWFESAWLVEHPECRLRYPDLRANPPHELLQVPLPEYLRSLDAFRTCRYLRVLEPLTEVVQWFREYGLQYRHIALTSTPASCAPISAAWVFQHFGTWIRTFHVVPSARDGQRPFVYDATKAAFLRWLGRTDIVFVDDRRENVDEARKLGLRVVTVPRPWNEAPGTVAEALEQICNLS